MLKKKKDKKEKEKFLKIKNIDRNKKNSIGSVRLPTVTLCNANIHLVIVCNHFLPKDEAFEQRGCTSLNLL